MILVILTVSICLTCGFEEFDSEENSVYPNFYNDTPYNIYDYIKELHLERCALVGIGLKYFALFIEDGPVKPNNTAADRKFFLGMCHQSTLEDWKFCSPALTKKRKSKCRFKISNKKYTHRVHRRFCDFSVMMNNKDCICDRTVYGDEMHKVKGFPTCFIPPLPESLCRYNVCGIAKCKPMTIENRLHTVQCDPHCLGRMPFCEYPPHQTAMSPAVRSSWSEWKDVKAKADDKNSRKSQRARNTKKKHSFAACINQYTRQGDVDCLGPSTGCCPESASECDCTTFEDDFGLKVERVLVKRDDYSGDILHLTQHHPSESIQIPQPFSFSPFPNTETTKIPSDTNQKPIHIKLRQNNSGYSFLDNIREVNPYEIEVEKVLPQYGCEACSNQTGHNYIVPQIPGIKFNLTNGKNCDENDEKATDTGLRKHHNFGYSIMFIMSSIPFVIN